MSIAANTPDERAQQMIDLTRRLTQQIQYDIDSLEAMKPQNLHETIEQTKSISSLYSIETARIKANPALLKGASQSLKAKLILETEEFQSLMQKYQSTVEAASLISEGLMGHWVKNLRTQAPQAAGYGATGQARLDGLNSLNYQARA
jgi:hypothetical protein